MNTHKPQAVFFKFPALQFRRQLLPADQQAIIRDCDLIESGLLTASRLKQVPNDPIFWELTIESNGHHWCMLAFWDQRYIDTNWLVVTHGFTKTEDSIPEKELSKAKEVYQQHFIGNKGAA